MNRTGCPEGWATDTLVYYGNTPLACDMSVVGWHFVIIGCVVIKVVTAAGYIAMWTRRERLFRERKVVRKTNGSRIPVVPVLACFAVAAYLTGTVVSLTLNGAAPGALAWAYGFVFLVFGLTYLGYVIKFIRLGHRIMPRTRQVAAEDQAALSTMDLQGKVHVIITVIALLGQTICFCVLALVFAGDYTIIRIGSGFNACFNATMAILLTHRLGLVRTA